MDGDQGATHKLNAVRMFILPDGFIDVPVLHPFRDHRKPAFAYGHSKQWQDIWMPKVFPGDTLSANLCSRFICTGLVMKVEDSR